MKRTGVPVRSFMVCLLFLVLISCVATPLRESTDEFIDDSLITTKIKSQLAGDDIMKAFQISVETFKGIVQLSGFVNSQRDVTRADEIARSVNGVRSVSNNLIVK